MTSLRKQIEALPEPHAWGECVKVADVLDIIDQHECGERIACVKCASDDIHTRWHRSEYGYVDGCPWDQRSDPGTSGEHLHRTCRGCGYHWADAVIAALEADDAKD